MKFEFRVMMLRAQTELSIWQDNLISNSYRLEADWRAFKLGSLIRKRTRCSHLLEDSIQTLDCLAIIQ